MHDIAISRRRALSLVGKYIEALRPHHWLKNLLVFLPLIATHRVYEPEMWLRGAIAWVAYSLTASAIYLINDLIDLPGDRAHPVKRHRPLAAGEINAGVAKVLAPMLLLSAVAIASVFPWLFLCTLTLYFVLMVAYSISLKHIPIADVLVLAMGYAFRVAAGSFALGIAPSPWLLAFCAFLFFSLAFVKRYSDLVFLRHSQGASAHVRDYIIADSPLMLVQGVASGYLSVLVLALYTNSKLMQHVNGRAGFYWITCLALFYWVSYLWRRADRGCIEQDPVAYAVRDRTSRWLLVIMAASVLLAS